MKRSSSLNLALVWAGAASVLTGLAATPFLIGSHPAASVRVEAATTAPQATTPSAARLTPSDNPTTASPKASATARRAASTPTPVRTSPAAASFAPADTPASTPPSPPKSTSKPPAPATPPSGNYIAIGDWTKPIVVAIGSQAAINACGPASLWYGTLPSVGSGITWLAGHNYCGFAFWDKLSIGTTVTIHDSAGTFTYRIVSRTRLDHQGGTAVGILHDDLILQTCTDAGTSLTYADLISSTP